MLILAPIALGASLALAQVGDQADCEVLVDGAIAEVRERGLDEADAILGRVRDACPQSSRPASELAGVRFAQHRWT